MTPDGKCAMKQGLSFFTIVACIILAFIGLILRNPYLCLIPLGVLFVVSCNWSFRDDSWIEKAIEGERDRRDTD